jgi:peroxiredoxin
VGTLLRLLLALPGAFLQEAPSRPTEGPEAEAIRALAELEARLLASRPGRAAESLPTSLRRWTEATRAAYLEFAAAHAGTEAGVRAGLRGAALLVQAEGKIDEGIAYLDALAKELRGTAGREALLSETLLTAGLLLRDAGRAEAARARLEEVLSLRAREPSARAAEGVLRSLETAKRVRPGEESPGFEAKDLEGRPVSPATLRGRVVLLDFWAAWSPLWRATVPARRELHRALAEKGFEIVGVCLDSAERFDRDSLGAFLRGERIPWPQVFDGAGLRSALARTFAVERVPASFLLDRKGKIRYLDPPAEELRARVEELLEEATHD